MNTAYKWYSYNSNIIQFYSGYSDYKSAAKLKLDNTEETVKRAYDYSVSFMNIQSDVSVG